MDTGSLQYRNYIHSYRLDTDTVEYTDDVATIPGTVYNTACLASSTTPSPRLYVTGGGVIWETPRDTVYILNVADEEWLDEGPSMQNARRGHGCIVVEDTLYVVGGGVAAVEALNINMNSGWGQWEDVVSLPADIADIAEFGQLVAFDAVIYIIG